MATALKPWFHVVQPREDLREERPLDASEFAVELDAIRKGEGPADYRDPARFFERTYLTHHLRELGAQVLRRLGGSKVESSALYSLVTQFGGGKTHAMAMLYHLSQGGSEALTWRGVDELRRLAEVTRVPKARAAIFVGTMFDPTVGRSDGGVTRVTPWGEIAWQLGGAACYEVVARHDRERVAPGGDVVREMLPRGEPVLILLDELMSFVGRRPGERDVPADRKSIGFQLYHFLQSLSEVARASDQVVVVTSLQASTGETTPDEVRDLQNFRHMFNRLGRSIVLSVEDESAEIIRRRLFEWNTRDDKAIKATTRSFAETLEANRALVPTWFPVDDAQARFEATYPFHPSVLSVFERKWKALPKFQQTRAMLRLLALWVSRAYAEAMRSGGARDPLITLGSAPLDDATFRTAVFDQLNDLRQLETAVTTDIDGRSDSMARRLDAEGSPAMQQGRTHRKTATTIFFESNGGQSNNTATQNEVHLAMIEPGRDVVNIQTALDGLVQRCHYLTQERASYRFSLRPNLNKLLADRREGIKDPAVEARARDEVKEVFTSERGISTVLFPTEAKQIPDHPRIVVAVIGPERTLADPELVAWMSRVTRERVYKSAIFWLAPDRGDVIADRARDLLTWQAVGDVDTLSESQQDQLREGRRRAAQELRRAVWEAYTAVLYLGPDQTLRKHVYGPLNPSASERMLDGFLQNLQTYSIIERQASPGYVVRRWPPAVTEWSTRAVRDVFFQSPDFPRLLSADTVKDMIARGVSSGDFALVTRAPGGGYGVFKWKDTLSVADIIVDDDTFLLLGDAAKQHAEAQRKPTPSGGTPRGLASAEGVTVKSSGTAGAAEPERSTVGPTRGNVRSARWSGELSPLLWMKFYQKVLTPFVSSGAAKLRLTVDLEPKGGLTQHQIDEIRGQLEALGLSTRIDTEE